MSALRILLPLLLLLPVAVACGGGGGERAAATDKYEVRGEVKDVGGEGDAARATIAHEEIPTFKDRKGREVGMKPMQMAFGIGSGVDRAVLATGNKVELVVEVDWSREPALMITSAKALPADTALKL